MTQRKPRLLSVCTGIGGIDLAAEWAGFEVAGQVEIEDFPTRVLEARWPDVPRARDLLTLRGDEIAGRFGHIDLLAGGIPCQGNSVAGARRGRADERNLWPAVARILAESLACGAPIRWLLVENVSGLRSASVVGGTGADSGLFGDILRDLAKLGYRAGWASYGAGDVGAPHRRERVFIVGYARHAQRAGWNPSATGSARGVGAGQSPRDEPASHGGDVADASGQRRDRGTNTAGRHDTDGHTARWAQGDGGIAQSSALADPAGGSRRGATPRNRRLALAGDTPVADAAGARLPLARRSERATRDPQAGAGLESEPERCGERCGELADAGGARLQGSEHPHASGGDDLQARRPAGRPDAGGPSGEVECRLGRGAPRLPDRLDLVSLHGWCGQWPTGPGQPQHDWEPPRVTPPDTRSPDRAARLKALGNAVVPAQIFPVLAAIIETMTAQGELD